MIVRIVCELEDVGWKRCLARGCVAVFGSVLVQHGVGVAWNVLVRVDGDESRASDVRIDGVGHESFADA